jgi:hypothetical protein
MTASAGAAARVADMPAAPAGSSNDNAFKVRFMIVLLSSLNRALFH